jgi:hypothetical protein
MFGCVILKMVYSASDVAFFADSYDIGKFISVARRFPHKRMHKYTAIDADNIVAHLDISFPPCVANIAFKF